MSQFDQASIPIKMPQAQKPEAEFKPIIERSPNSGFLRKMLAGLLLVTLPAAAWLGWGLMHSASHVDDEESIADMEGFDLPASKKRKDVDSRSLKLGAPAGNSVGSFAMPDLSESLLPPSDAPPSADVWLTGTIEEPDSTERIELPLRLTGEPNESSSIR